MNVGGDAIDKCVRIHLVATSSEFRIRSIDAARDVPCWSARDVKTVQSQWS